MNIQTKPMNSQRQKRWMPVWLRIAAFLALLLPVAQTALAHPLGNFSVNYYSRLEAHPGAIQIVRVIDLAEIPTYQLKQKIDKNGDGTLDPAEQAAFLAAKIAEVRSGMALLADGAPLPLIDTPAPVPALLFEPGQGGLDTMRITFQLSALLPVTRAPIKIEYRDDNESDRLGWREIVLHANGDAAVSEASVSDQDVSHELRAYPADLLSSPLKQTRAAFTLNGGGVAGGVAGSAGPGGAPAVFGAARNDSQFSALINYKDLTPQVIAISLLSALGLGALHALEPGHGKSLAGAYLIGSRATPYHAALLGGTVTVTHTASVFVMGLVTLFASNFIVPERLFPYLGLFSAGIVIVMGGVMITNGLRARRADVATDHAHEFDDASGQISHAHGGRSHTHVPSPVDGKLSVRRIMAVGISGGLVPCPAALIVLLSAVALGRIGFGLLLILAFSIGLAAVLTAVSLAVVYGKRMIGRTPAAARLLNRLSGSKRLISLLPIASGFIVLAAGFLLLYYALPFLKLI